MKVWLFATFFVFFSCLIQTVYRYVYSRLLSHWVKISSQHWICCCQYSADGDDQLFNTTKTLY